MFVSLPMVIYLTATPTLDGEIRAADFSIEHEEKTNIFLLLIEFLWVGWKLAAFFWGNCLVHLYSYSSGIRKL